MSFPPGRFVVTKPIDVRKAVVLRGAGRDATTLVFPKSLQAVTGREGWSHGTCYINFWGYLPTVRGAGAASTQLARVTADAARGARTLTVDSTAGLKPGQWVRVVLADSGAAARRVPRLALAGPEAKLARLSALPRRRRRLTRTSIQPAGCASPMPRLTPSRFPPAARLVACPPLLQPRRSRRR